ncbi:MAG: RepB family DNA primase [Acidobacteriota bacterium]|nr:RepB family DNA primase [Acidobacteriota bacterium]
MERTVRAVERQIRAMGCEMFELGLFKPEVRERGPIMIPRTWDADTLVRSVPWLRGENREGRNIFCRPKGEHKLSLIDDLSAAAVMEMKRSGFGPALVVETSPRNFQAWVKHFRPLPPELSTAVAKALAAKFGGDTGAADWRHFGRLAGFTNRKLKYCDVVTGLYPFVHLIESSGREYPEAARLADAVEKEVEQRREFRSRVTERFANGSVRTFKTIDEFRADARYGNDGTRIDLAYAIYALAHGSSAEQVEGALRSRDLSHKGSNKRQDDYIERTIKKALSTVDRCCGSRGR